MEKRIGSSSRECCKEEVEDGIEGPISTSMYAQTFCRVLKFEKSYIPIVSSAVFGLHATDFVHRI